MKKETNRNYFYFRAPPTIKAKILKFAEESGMTPQDYLLRVGALGVRFRVEVEMPEIDVRSVEVERVERGDGEMEGTHRTNAG